MKQWLTGLIQNPDPEDMIEVANCVELVYSRFRPKDRSLKNVYMAAFRDHSNARSCIGPWINPDQFGTIFNAHTDSIGEILQESPIPLIGYDCTQAFDDPYLSNTLISYLTYRLRQMSPGKPSMIFIDETEPLLDNEAFQRTYRTSLQEARKMRHVVVSCFQRPGAIQRTGMSQVIRGQCPTMIFAQNPQAVAEDYSHFDLSDGERAFVLGEKRVESRRAFLVKRYEGPHTAILDLDLSSLGDLLKVFSSGRAMVMELRSAMRGKEPRLAVLDWLGVVRQQEQSQKDSQKLLLASSMKQLERLDP